MKILITGASGYIGTGVVKRIRADGHEVVSCGRKICDIPGFIATDIFNIDKPFDYFGKPDVLLHLAWEDGFKHNSNSHIDNLHKHYHFIEKMVAGGTKQVCIMGSVHEVGFFEGSVNENTPTKPKSLYGISKNALRDAVELLCNSHNVIFQWIRGFYIVGNTGQGYSVFSKIVDAEKNGDRLFPFTKGTNQFDFIDYDEFCRQVSAVVEQNVTNGIINCCSGFPEKIGERVERFIGDNKFGISLDYGKFPDRTYDSKAVWGNNCKINHIMKMRESNNVK